MINCKPYLIDVRANKVFFYFAITSSSCLSETAEVNMQLDFHAGGEIYRCKHPLRTYVAFQKLRKKFFKWKKETS